MKWGCFPSLALLAGAVFFVVLGLAEAAKPGSALWTDPVQAAAEDPDFAVQGEYSGKGMGVQVAALGKGRFYLSRFNGGLPGAGWDKSAPEAATVDKAGVEEATKGMKRARRASSTMGRKPPEGADILVGEGVNEELIKGNSKDQYLWAGSRTLKEYGDFTMHLEFRLPYKPNSPLSSQDRGNSGVYLQNRYEVQILDSFGLVFDREQVAIPVRSGPRQWCGCLYGFKVADTPMCLPPLTWQTYDLDFTAPCFDSEGRKTADATITVRHNGVLIHQAVRLPKGTGAGGGRREIPKGPVIFQGHGNPVAFRNVWILER
ncbi:MAG: DUF1080 domain-containing protein [Akkermansiaceae bacterium]|nr:DUF1080 domain-containing protein [Akkermansiaceae bacterium]